MLVRLRFVSNTVVWVPLQILACETYEAGLRGPAGDPACERITLRGWHASIRRDNRPEPTAPADRVGAQLTWVAPSPVRVIDAELINPHYKMWKHASGGSPLTSARRPDFIRHKGQDEQQRLH